MPAPTALDGTAVRQSINAVKSALATTFPDKKALIDDHPTWPLIEAMALATTYSARELAILLANPLHLSPSDLAFRKELIRAFRDRQLSHPLPNRNSATSISLRSHGPPVSTHQGVDQTGCPASDSQHRTRFPR